MVKKDEGRDEPKSLAHEIFDAEYIEAEISKLPPEVLDGRNPEVFAFEMAQKWMYGKSRAYSDGERNLGYFSFLGVSHLPERLRPGLAAI